MDTSLLKQIGALQSLIRERGLGGRVLAVHESKLSSDDEGPVADDQALFEKLVLVPEIAEVSRDLFASGFYSQAVDEAFKIVEAQIQHLSAISADGPVALSRIAFDPNDPKLVWSPRMNQAEKDEQIGYYHLYCGSFEGIVTPVRSTINWIADANQALDGILLAQHLYRKLASAKGVTPLAASEI